MQYETLTWDDNNPNYVLSAERVAHLDQGILNEETRAEAREAVLATSVTTEKSRAEVAENVLRSLTEAVANGASNEVKIETARAEAAEKANKTLATETKSALETEVSRATTKEATLLPLVQKGKPLGVAELNASGKVPSAQLPPGELADTKTLKSDAEQIALAEALILAPKTTIVVREDTKKIYIWKGTNTKSVAGDWTELPFAGILEINGKTGSTVELLATDVKADKEGAATTAKTEAEAAATTKTNTEKTRAEAAETERLKKSENLKDLPSPVAARTSLGLGSAALEPASAFDAAGAAATAQANAKTFTEGQVTSERTRAVSAEALLLPKSSETIIPAWQPETLYALEDQVTHLGILYIATEKHTSGPTFEIAKWKRPSIGGGGGGAVSSVNSKIGAVVLTPEDIGSPTTLLVAPWEMEKEYAKGALAAYGGKVYSSNALIPAKSKKPFEVANWTLIGVKQAREFVWLQDFGVQVGKGAGDQAKKCQEAVDHAAESNGTAVVRSEPGEIELKERTVRNFKGIPLPYGEVWASIHIPQGVSIKGDSSTGGLRFLGVDPKIKTEEEEKGGSRAYIIALRGGSKTQKVLEDLEVSSSAISWGPRTVGISKIPPVQIDGVLINGPGSLFKCRINGGMRAGVSMHCDHFTIFECDIGGWAKLAWGSTPGGGNNIIWNCGLVSGFCSLYVEPGGRIGGTAFEYGHMGFSAGPCVYKHESEKANETFISALFKRVTFEEPGRGIFVDESMESAISGLQVIKCLISPGGVGPLGGRVRGDITQPSDAIVKAGSVNKLEVDGFLFTNAGYEPGIGCAIRVANKISDSHLGVISTGLKQARGLNLPFIRAGSISGVTAEYEDQGNKASVYFRTVKGPANISKYDLVRSVPSGVVSSAQMYGEKFNSANAIPDGFSLVSASVASGEEVIIPIAIPDKKEQASIIARLAHLGTGTLAIATTPITLAGATTEVTNATTEIVANTTNFPPKGNLLLFGTGGEVSYGKIEAGKFLEVAPVKGLPVKLKKNETKIELITWPLNPRGAQAELVAPLDLGQGLVPPILIHQAAWTSEKIRTQYLSTLADFPPTGATVSVGGTVFHYKEGIGIPTTSLAGDSGQNAKFLQLNNIEGFPTAPINETATFLISGSKAFSHLYGEFTLSLYWEDQRYVTPPFFVAGEREMHTTVAEAVTPTLAPFTIKVGEVTEILPNKGSFPANGGSIKIGKQIITYEKAEKVSAEESRFVNCKGGEVGVPIAQGSVVTVVITAAEVATAIKAAKNGKGEVLPGTVTVKGGPLPWNETTITFEGLTPTTLIRNLQVEEIGEPTGETITFKKAALATVRVGNSGAATYSGIKTKLPKATVETAGSTFNKKSATKIKVVPSSISGFAPPVPPSTFASVGGGSLRVFHASFPAPGYQEIAFRSVDLEKGEITGVPGGTIAGESILIDIPAGATVEGFPELTDTKGLSQSVPKGTPVVIEGVPAELKGTSGGTVKSKGSGVKAKVLRVAQVSTLSGFSTEGGVFRIDMEPKAEEKIPVWCLYSGIAEVEPRTRYIGKELEFPFTSGQKVILGASDTSLFLSKGHLKAEASKGSGATLTTVVVDIEYQKLTTAETKVTAGPVDLAIVKVLEVEDTKNFPTAGFAKIGPLEFKYSAIKEKQFEGITEGKGIAKIGDKVTCDTFAECTSAGHAGYKIKPGITLWCEESAAKRKYLTGISSEGYKPKAGEFAVIPPTTKLEDQPVLAVSGSSGYPNAPASLGITGSNAQMPYEKFITVGGGETLEEVFEEEEAEGEEFVEEEIGETLLRSFFVLSKGSRPGEAKANFVTATEPLSSGSVVGGTILTSAVTNILTESSLKVQSTMGFPSSGWIRLGVVDVFYKSLAEAQTTLSGSGKIKLAAEITVESTVGFPASGTLEIAKQKITYGKIVGNIFKECVGGTGEVAAGTSVNWTKNEFLELEKATAIVPTAYEIGQPVTFTIGKQLAAGVPLRGAYSGVFEGNMGNVAATKPGDANGWPIGAQTSYPDEGGFVQIEM